MNGKEFYLKMRKSQVFGRITQVFSELYKLVFYGRIATDFCWIIDEKEFIYFNNCKVACSSIKATFVDKEIKDNGDIEDYSFLKFKYKRRLSQKERDYYKFTFVRNPFPRLVSCYESKYHNDKKNHDRKVLEFDNYLNGYIKKDEGFEVFVKKICRLPNCLMDPHFVPQSYVFCRKDGTPKLDHIGKIETINEEYSVISKRFGLKELPHFNRTATTNWKDYYTKELAELVYNKYKNDIEWFGYEQSYIELVDYLDGKETK